MRQLRGRVAVVTGAGSGIGRALAHALAREGAALALSDIDEISLAETAAALDASALRVTSERVDVAQRDAVEAHAERVVREHGGVHLVINNAGVALASRISEMRHEDLAWLMGINFWGVVHGTKAFLPHLLAAEEGHIVNLSSAFGLLAVPGQGAYNAAKFAVRGYTECLRQELELEGASVSATSVHPGGIRTNIVRRARVPELSAQEMSREEAQQAFERVARTSPERAAEIILRGVRRNARRVLIGWDARGLDLLQRLLPGAYQRVIVAGVRRRGAVPS